MKKFRIEFTAAENNFTFAGEWDTEIVPAEAAEEAVELLKQHFIENDCDPAAYIFRVADVGIPTIREIRAHTGLTQAAFAEKFLIPKRTVENWEGGKTECAIYIRKLLAEACGIK